MQDRIEIVDRDRNTKATYILQKNLQDDSLEQNKLYLEFVSYVFKAFKFCLYLIVSFLKLLAKVLEVLFLQEYEPFKFIKDYKSKKADEKLKNYINKDTKIYGVTSHRYEFIRSRVYALNYLKIKNILKKCSEHNVKMGEEVAKDVLNRIDLIIVEAERQALAEGYKYAKESHFQFESTEAFDRYIKDRVMKGEDYREHNKEMLERLSQGKSK